jgi:hypothetical protein
VRSYKEKETSREEKTGKIPCLANSVMMLIYIRKRGLAEKRKQERFLAWQILMWVEVRKRKTSRPEVLTPDSTAQICLQKKHLESNQQYKILLKKEGKLIQKLTAIYLGFLENW